MPGRHGGDCAPWKEDLELLFGISFGTADPAAPVNAVGRTRIPLQQSVVLHGTPGVLDGR
ncbi:hypothetical protein [Nocardia abscessus]|uniref:hypothetical protein n=1 Tax=Nocardia abscessus TaxID=120957 RepID=UPI00245786A8|nr:hypothetical protein [Nocardia abscessus]